LANFEAIVQNPGTISFSAPLGISCFKNEHFTSSRRIIIIQNQRTKRNSDY